MTNKLATILHKLDRDAEERAEEREWKRIQLEKEEERKRMVLEAELEEKCREQKRRYEIQMQSMIFNDLQQLQCMQYPAAQNPSLYRSSTTPMSFFPPCDDMPAYLPPCSFPNDFNLILYVHCCKHYN